MLFREYLAELMAEKGITNAQLADEIHNRIGKVIEASQVSKWLRGRQKPSKLYAKAIAETFKKTFGELWKLIQAEKLISANFPRLARYMGEDLDLERIMDESARQLIEFSRGSNKNATFMRLSHKNVSDIDWILSFDHSIYPTPSPVTKEILQAWLQAENKLSFVLKHGQELKAFCVAIPIEDQAFEEILSGKREEFELLANEIGTQFRNHYVYSNMAYGSYYAGHMLARIAFLFNIYNMRRIGGLVVTEDEDRLCKRLQLAKVWVDETFPTKFKPVTYMGDASKLGELSKLLKQFDRYIEIIES